MAYTKKNQEYAKNIQTLDEELMTSLTGYRRIAYILFKANLDVNIANENLTIRQGCDKVKGYSENVASEDNHNRQISLNHVVPNKHRGISLATLDEVVSKQFLVNESPSMEELLAAAN